jgi:hypothetical protein
VIVKAAVVADGASGTAGTGALCTGKYGVGSFRTVEATSVVAQQANRGEMQRAPLDQLENSRELPCDASDRDAVKRLAIAQPQPLGAIGKERFTRVLHVQLALVELGQVRDDPCLRPVALRKQLCQVLPQLII